MPLISMWKEDCLLQQLQKEDIEYIWIHCRSYSEFSVFTVQEQIEFMLFIMLCALTARTDLGSLVLNP